MEIIWLTPDFINETFCKVLSESKNKNIVFIGDKDPCYVPSKIDPLKNIRVIENADHGLDVTNSVLKSLDILKEIIEILDINV